MVIFLTRPQLEQKRLCNTLFTFCSCAGCRARGAVGRLAEAWVTDQSLVLASAAR